MDANEDYVRSVWRNVREYADRTSCAVVILTGSDAEDVHSSDFERTTKESAWSAAAQFTRDRLEQVRQVREEIEVVRRRKHEDGKYPAIAAVWSRILARLEAELTRLTAGMRPEKAGSK